MRKKKMHLGKLVIYLGVLIILQLVVLIVDAGKGEKEKAGGRCFEEERMGLLELKSFFVSMGPPVDRYPIYTWVSDDHHIIPSTTTCCEWELVTCNHTTGHVTELALSSMFDYVAEFPPAWDVRDLNVSLFLPFKDLQSLNLSSNSFSGWIQDEGFERLSSLRNLKMLDLGFNRFGNRTIFQDLGVLTSLRTLILTAIFPDEEVVFPAHELSNLKNLENLDLSYNKFRDTTTKHDCASLSRLKKLETLSLSGITFNKTIIPCLSAFPSLKNLYFANLDQILQGAFIPQEILVLDKLETLDLSSNWFSSSPTKKDCKSLSKFKKLENLYLENNSFNETVILVCLSALPSLKNLYLKGNELGMPGGSIPAQELSVLDKLETLDLSGNSLSGSLTKKDCQSLSKLRGLRHLDLSGNNFDRDILRCLGNLSSLKYLKLTLYAPDAPSPLSNQEITHLSNLEVLILEGASGTLPMEGLASFRNLEILDLTGNSFVGSISSSISALSSLKALSLAGNKLGGSLPTQGFCELKELEELDLSGNMFVGTLPPCLSNLTSLRFLDLSQNQFSGRVPPSLITDFTALEFIDLSYNNLEGVFSFISSSAKIRILNLAHNMMEGSFSSSSLQIFTKLEYLNLRNNSFSGTFHLPPDRQSNLHLIDISDNHFTGRMQANIGQILPVVSYLNFSSNCFEGDINNLIGGSEMSNLQLLDLSVNKFSGQILPSNLSSLRHLSVLDISHNSFSGNIPTSIYNMTALVALSMQNNFFQGNFPTDLLKVNEIQFLDVSHNLFSGSLSSFSSLGNLHHLHLQTNRFTGPIPHSFSSSNLSGLVSLDISDNNLSGHLPSFIGEFPDLRVISVRGNDFSGFIPNELCQLATISLMDLSNNSFSGSLPHCFHNITFFAKTEASVPVGRFPPIFSPVIYDLFVDDSYTNIILGNTKSYMQYYEYNIQDEVEFGTKHNRNAYAGGRILNYMSGLDLSSNNLTGKIPPEFGMLREIRALNLSHNQLTGPIPKAFSNLTQIESLDLSFNCLSGQIPSELIDLNFLAVFSVAHNNLSGRLPERKKQFATFEGNSYEGNQFQCGLPVVDENCITGGFNNSTPSPQDESEEEDKWYEVDRVFFSASFVAAYTVFFFGYGALLYINPNWRRRWFNLIEECMYSCYYFLYDSLHKLSALVHA